MMCRSDVGFLVKMCAHLDYLKVTFIPLNSSTSELLRDLKGFYLIFNKDLEKTLHFAIVHGG